MGTCGARPKKCVISLTGNIPAHEWIRLSDTVAQADAIHFHAVVVSDANFDGITHFLCSMRQRRRPPSDLYLTRTNLTSDNVDAFMFYGGTVHMDKPPGSDFIEMVVTPATSMEH